MEQWVSRVIKSIQEKKLRIAFAESVTCGLIAHKLGSIKAASEFFMGSVVCYNPGVKTGLLCVPEKLITKYSTESPEVTRSLAKNLSRVIDADLYGAVTGLATPDPTARHAAGTIFLCLFDGKNYVAEEKHFRGSPYDIRKKAFLAMIKMVGRKIA